MLNLFLISDGTEVKYFEVTFVDGIQPAHRSLTYAFISIAMQNANSLYPASCGLPIVTACMLSVANILLRHACFQVFFSLLAIIADNL